VGTLTDARIYIVKTALQLTPAIRARAKDQQARIANVEARVDRSPIEVLRDRNPVEFMHRRADALAQRAADLRKRADAWQPLYQTLNPEQKRRMGALTITVLREMRDAVEQHRVQSEDDDDGE
jgi:hypothetical protein